MCCSFPISVCSVFMRNLRAIYLRYGHYIARFSLFQEQCTQSVECIQFSKWFAAFPWNWNPCSMSHALENPHNVQWANQYTRRRLLSNYWVRGLALFTCWFMQPLRFRNTTWEKKKSITSIWCGKHRNRNKNRKWTECRHMKNWVVWNSGLVFNGVSIRLHWNDRLNVCCDKWLSQQVLY